MKITIARCVRAIQATILAAAALCGLAVPIGVSQAGGGDDPGSCVSSVEYECAPGPHGNLPVE